MKSFLVSKLSYTLLSILFLYSCNSIENQEITSGNYATIRMSVTKSANPETQISSIRMILFNYESGEVRYNKLENNPSVIDDKIVLQCKAQKGEEIRIVIIANEPYSWDLNRQGITYSTLQNLEINYYDAKKGILNVPQPFLMMAESDKIVLSGDSPIDQTLSLVRNNIKITLKLKLSRNEPDFSVEKPILEALYVNRLPIKTRLFAGFECSNPDEDAHAKSETIDLQAIGFTDAGDYSTLNRELVFYVSEHKVKNKHKHSYIEITGITDKGNDVVYVIPLGDGVNKLYDPTNPSKMEELTGADLSTTRNTHYIIDATIKSLGRLDANIQVKEWTVKDVDGDIQTPYLNVSRVNHQVILKKESGEIKLPAVRIDFWSNYSSSDLKLRSTLQKRSVATGQEVTSEVNIEDVFTPKIVFTQSEPKLDGSFDTQGYVELTFKEPQAIYNDYDTKSYTLFFDGKNIKRNISLNFPYRHNLWWKDMPWVSIFYSNTTYDYSPPLGERIISARNEGAWSVDVEYPSGTPTDWVLLTTTPSPDGEIGTDNCADANAFVVTEGSSSVNGEGDIYFRTGLKNSLASPKIRYARLKVTTTDDISYIYLRQGSGHNTLMNPSDPIYEVNGGIATQKNRTDVVTIYTNEMDPNGVDDIETKKPSSNGGYSYGEQGIQEFWNAYNRSSGKVDLFHPFFKDAIYYTMTTSNPTVLWDVNGETCPEGFQHPTVAQLKNSLLQYYNADESPITDPTKQNYRFGYCADGVMDRRRIQKIETVDRDNNRRYNYCRSTYSVISPFDGTKYTFGKMVGMMFYNPDTFASLFFPASGYREYSGGVLQLKHAGALGLYWTREGVDESNKTAFTFGRTAAGVNYVNFITKPINIATGIRCVKK